MEDDGDEMMELEIVHDPRPRAVARQSPKLLFEPLRLQGIDPFGMLARHDPFSAGAARR